MIYRNTTARIQILAFLTLLIFLLAIDNVLARQPDYVDSEGPVPESHEDARHPLSHAFDEIDKEIYILLPEWKKKLESLPPFLRDTTFVPNARTYFFNNFTEDDNTIRNEAWALGGSLDYQSGWWKDCLKVRAVSYTTQKLYGPRDKDGTELLKPKQESFSVLGQANLEARIVEGLKLRVFRQAFNLPYLNKDDSRMIPNTFEAYTLEGLKIHKTDFIVSHVPKMKEKNSSKFIDMSEVAGVENSDKDLTLAGARYSFNDNFDIGFVNLYSWDLWNTAYAEANGLWKLTNNVSIKLSGQYTYERSVGDELFEEFNTDVYGGKVDLGYKGAILSFAFSSTDSDSDILNPYGGYPGYLSIIEKDFDRASEDAWLVGLSYHFSNIGIDGLSTFANYAKGNTPDSGSAASPDQDEFDFTVDYHFKNNRYKELKGLWLRFRGAFVDQDGPEGQDIDNYRFIINYEIPFF